MKRTAAFLLFAFVFSGLWAQTFSWPVDSVNLKGTFGQSRGGEFSTGLLLSGGDQAVKAAASGETVFIRRQITGGIPSGLGNYVVIEHDRGLRSVYGNLGVIPTDLADRVEGGTLLGLAGASGYVMSPTLYFEVYDQEFSQSVNPLLLLPPVIDYVRPEIGQVSISRQGMTEALQDGMVISSGKAEVLVQVQDTGPAADGNGYPVAPFAVSIFLNGEEIYRLAFEALQYEDGKLVVAQSGEASFKQVYSDSGLLRAGVASFSAGAYRLEVLLQDFYGNESLQRYRIQVE